MSHNFIGIYENALSADNCNKFIEFFESCDKAGFTVTRQQLDKVSKLNKQDDSLFLSDVLNIANYDLVNIFTNFFWSEIYPQYANEYAILSSVAALQIREIKLQRTQIGGGYHVWHCEQDIKPSSDRVLTFTCYLNDVEEGGETEFLYYPKRVKATQGTILIFPGSFTHAHRGNPPISNTKYIITGWLQFC
jgi:hypothetical protein